MRRLKLMPLLVAVALLCGCGHVAGVAEEKPQIVATNFVCYDFAREIAGEFADVTLLIDPGTEVHAYEPSPADILKMETADLFVYIGGESDVWAEKLLSSFDDREARLCVRMMESVEVVLEEEHEAHEEHDHEEHLEYDDHIWTSPKNAVDMLDSLCEAMCVMDEAHRAQYTANAQAYIRQIEEIDAAFEKVIQEGRLHTLIFADRFPFLYFVNAYHLDYLAAYPNCARDMEPSAQTMAELIRAVEMDGVKTIFTIEMSSGSIARTIAEETGAEIATMHSCQNVTLEEFNRGETYVSLMRANVDALRKGLA